MVDDSFPEVGIGEGAVKLIVRGKGDNYSIEVAYGRLP